MPLKNIMQAKSVALVTARGGSKRLPRKNALLLGGRPLLAWSIEAALNAAGVRRVIMSTDDPELMQLARDAGAEVPFVRPADLSGDKSSHYDVVRHAIEWVRRDEGGLPEMVVLLQPTSPFRTHEDIDGLIDLMDNSGADSGFSVSSVESHPNYIYRLDEQGVATPLVEGRAGYVRSQDLEPFFQENGACYAMRPKTLLERLSIIGPNSVGYVMPAERSVDIDTELDFVIAAALFEHRNRRKKIMARDTSNATDAAKLAALATGREKSLFAGDMAANEAALRNALAGKRVLAIGAAGSIGSSTVSCIASFEPAALHVIDQNENGLAELVRQLRSGSKPLRVADFQTLPLDYGSTAFLLFLASQSRYNVVLNFAALKHVRSEKDPFSALQMFETNLTKQVRLIRALGRAGFEGRFFNVSTDKAANPSSMMGASKRAMEHVMFNSTAAAGLGGIKTSARFANVAFSNGSLLQSFEKRLARGEPLAAPGETRRYFVSMEESGEICTLAALLAPDRHIVVPQLDPKAHLVEMQSIAERFLRLHGYESAIYQSEDEARGNVEADRTRNRWPLLVTPLDTAGEKPYEEFIADGESIADIGLKELRAVRYLPADRNGVDRMLAELDGILSGSDTDISKDRLKNLLATVEPAFLESHRESKLNLDQRI